jgi:hypothetical protein
VVLVEASDLVRYEAVRSSAAGAAARAMRLAVLERTDALVGSLVAEVDPDRDAVMVMGPVHPGSRGQLTPFALRAPGLDPGWLQSGFTRRSGVLAIVDLGPTVVDLAGIEPPDSMEGRPAERAGDRPDLDDAIEHLITDNEMSVFRDKMIPKVTTVFVLLQIVALGAAILVFVRGWRRAMGGVEVAACALLAYLPMTYLARLVPFHDLGAGPYWLFLLGGALALGGAVWFAGRGRTTTMLIAMLAIVVGLLVGDALSGAWLQYNTAMGYSATIAGRFAGLGNLAYSQLAAGGVLLAALVADRVGGRRGAWVAAAGLGALIIVDGAPMWGSDVGGVLSMAPAFLVTVVMLLGWRVRVRLVVLGSLASLALLGVFAAIDLQRPADERTHLGRLVETARDRGWDGVSTILLRKLDQNLAVLFTSVWTIMLPVVLGGIAYLVYRAPGRLGGIYERFPTMRAGLAGLGVLALFGFALNDSGIAVPGVMLGVMTPVLVVLLAVIEREARVPSVEP